MEFWRNWFVEEKIKNFRKVENEPFWSEVKFDIRFGICGQITYETMFVWAVWASVRSLGED